MLKIMRLALKNLLRYKRRSLLTGLLIAVGLVAVIVFVGLSGAFKDAIVGQITDSVLSHLQVHRRGYMASIDNLPLDRMLSARAYARLASVLEAEPVVAAYSARIKFGAMLSDYAQTTNVRLNGVDPQKERLAVPLLPERIVDAVDSDLLLEPGQVLLPEVLAKGMGIQVGDTIVLVAHNKEGSVNGMTFSVAGVVEGLMGPGGRDGYLHIDDAATLLRMEANRDQRSGRARQRLRSAAGNRRPNRANPGHNDHCPGNTPVRVAHLGSAEPLFQHRAHDRYHDAGDQGDPDRRGADQRAQCHDDERV
jgi:putative ABC transport system permease protein